MRFFGRRRNPLRFVIAMVVSRITVAWGSICLVHEMHQYTGSSCTTETFKGFNTVGALSIDELIQLPESFLQLEVQRQKPGSVPVAALFQSGRLLSTLELNDSALRTLELNDSKSGAAHKKRIEHLRRLPKMLSHRVSRGVSATGELLEAGQMITSANDTGGMLRLKAEEPRVAPRTSGQALWPKVSPRSVLSFLQAYSCKDSLAEGVLIFVLVNVFCCAVTSGMYFIYSARKGMYEGQVDESEDEDPLLQPPIRMPRGHHEYPQSMRPAHDSGVPTSTRQQKPASIGSWSPLAPGAPQSAEAQYHPRQSETSASTRRHLCPELVVPRGSECVLAVRTLVSARLQQVEFDILDVNGKPVLQVEVSPQFTSHSRPWPTQLQRSPTVTLKSLHPRESTGGFVLCYCCNVTKEDEGSGSKRNVYIYKNDDELFAHLMKDEVRKRYVLTSGRLGLQLLFEGNFEEHAVDVSNESRELLAATEPGVMDFDPINKYYKLRVAADVDVGLVLSGLLAIDQMEVP